jgi:MinD-like ATPase involved in chromosome partitioning or flagellar assembly
VPALATKQKKSQSGDGVMEESTAVNDGSVTGTVPADDDMGEPDDAPMPTVSVDLPAPVHVAPEHELAVAIDDVPVNPGQVSDETSTTMSVVLDSSAHLQVDPEATGEHAEISDAVYSRRDRLRGQVSDGPEPAAMLTAERLLDAKKRKRPRPEGGWPAFVYAITFHLVNLGDSPKVRARKEVDARIDRQFEGGTRFVPVLTRKGGVGKTTITALIGMAMADVREDRIVAIAANPDRGTLAERVNKQTRATVRDIVTQAASINSFNDFSTMVSRDETRLDILASDTDPLLAQAFDENDYNVVADLCARFYSVCLTDCGTGIVHSVMRATLQRADSVVIVSGGSVDEARLASETLTWLESNGYADLVKNAVVALNTGTQGTNLVKLDEIEAHFTSRVREIVRIPYDPQLAAGSVIDYKELRPLTKAAARELAALVMDGLPASKAR